MASTVLPNGIIIPEKYSRDWYADLYHNWQELDNLLGGGTPKDGTLTIQKNGDTVGTFSANQATNETINITVPTATSELTNDSNFVESSDLATVATSGSYTDLSDKPTIPTVNNATLTIQQNGTTVDTFTANSSSDKTVNIQCVDLTNNQTVAGNKEFTGTTTAHDLVPSATDTYNFGSSSYQWNNAYIKSLTINGTQFLPSDYMTLNTTQTVTGAKNYSNVQSINAYRLQIKSQSQEKGVIPASNQWNGFTFNDKNDERMFSIEQGVMPNGVIQLSFSGRANDNDTTFTNFLRYINNSDLTTNCVNIIDLIPFGDGTRKLGDTNAKWKSFNGLNPGALSLPSMTYIYLDTTGFDVTSTTIGTFTPTIDGWAILNISQKNKPFGIWIVSGGYRVTFQSVHHDDNYMIFALIPVRANVNMTIYSTADDIDSTRKIDWLRLFPCQGNV